MKRIDEGTVIAIERSEESVRLTERNEKKKIEDAAFLEDDDSDEDEEKGKGNKDGGKG